MSQVVIKRLVLVSIPFFLLCCSNSRTLPTQTATQTITMIATAIPLPSANPTEIRYPPTATSTANPPLPLFDLAPAATQTVAPVAENMPLTGGKVAIQPENAAQLAELARWGSGNANDLAFSPDGTFLAVASPLGLYLYDKSYRLIYLLPSTHALTSLAFSNDGAWLAAGNADGKIEVWDFRTRILTTTLDSGWHQPVEHLVFNPNLESIGYIQATPLITLQIQNVSNGRILFKIPLQSGAPFTFSLDGSAIFISGEGFWKIALPSNEFKNLARLEAGDRIIRASISPDGKLFAAAGAAKIYLWKNGEDSPFQTIVIPARAPNSASPTSTCANHTDVERLSQINALAVSPDGQLLAVGLADDTLQVRRIMDGTLIAESPRGPIRSEVEIGIERILFHPHEPLIAVLYKTGRLELRDRRSAGLLRTVGEHTTRFSSLAFSPAVDPGYSFLAVGASDESVRVWNLATGKRALTFAGQAEAVAFSPDGEMLAIGSLDWTVRWIRMFDGKLWGPLGGHQDAVSSLAFLNGGNILITGSRDCTIRYWDVAAGKPYPIPLIEMPGVQSSIRQVLTSPDGKRLVVLDGSRNSWVIQNPVGDRSTLEPLEVFSGAVSLALSADGALIAGISYDQASVLEFGTRQIVASWKMAGTSLAFSPDGKILAVGDEKGRLALFSLENNQRVRAFTAHGGEIGALAFSPDGRFLASASADGTVRIWGIP